MPYRRHNCETTCQNSLKVLNRITTDVKTISGEIVTLMSVRGSVKNLSGALQSMLDAY